MLAYSTSQQDALSSDRLTRAWALGNLIELNLLNHILGKVSGKSDCKASKKTMISLAKQLVVLVGQDDFVMYSTRRQIKRYAVWYPKFAELNVLEGLAADLLKYLPSTWEPKHRASSSSDF